MPEPKVSSDYGLLNLCKADRNPHVELPKLQFEDADVVIKLDYNPEEWLFVHSSVLRANSAYFHASLSENCNHTTSGITKILHPTTGQEVSMRCRALRVVDGTYLLEGQDFTPDSPELATLFSESSLALPGWPKRHHSDDNKDWTKRALRVFFALLYGAKLDCQQVRGHPIHRWTGINTNAINYEVFYTLVATCAYAEYWGCLRLVGNAALAVLQSAPSYWEVVSTNPLGHLAFAVKMENAELYYDAFRHSLVNSYHDDERQSCWGWRHMSDDWQVVSELTGTSEEELRRFYSDLLKQQGPLEKDTHIKQLLEDLRSLQLQEARAKPDRDRWQKVRTRFIDALVSRMANRLKHSAERDAADFLSRAIYGEYLAYKLTGQKIYEEKEMNIIRAERAGDLLHLFYDIEHAATLDDPSQLFDAAACIRFATLFKFTPKQKHQLQKYLQRLVRQADDIIKNAFCNVYSRESYEGKIQDFCQSRTKFVHHFRTYSTYLMVPTKLPWSKPLELSTLAFEEAAVPAFGKIAIPNISVADASAEWTSTLMEHFGGKFDEEQQDEGEVAGAEWEGEV